MIHLINKKIRSHSGCQKFFRLQNLNDGGNILSLSPEANDYAVVEEQ